MAVLIATAAVVTGCSSASSSGPSAESGAIRVVAGENVWGSIAAQIGGSHVSVTSIISDPNTDPHDYETDPDDAAAVAKAKVVIENGAGYDDFLSKIVSASGGSKQVINVQKITNVTGSDPNPHLWYSPTFVAKAAAAMQQQFAADDPTDATAFTANLATFTKSYQPYLDTIAAIKAKYDGAAISYTERVPGYLVTAAGLHLGTPAGFSQAVEDGTDPTPADTAAFNADITGHQVKVLLYNSQVVDAQTTQIKKTATSAGVPIVGVSETIPAQYSTFQAWQIAQARALLKALGG
jgi:zinc/manganese transport system substrate-binding protein